MVATRAFGKNATLSPRFNMADARLIAVRSADPRLMETPRREITWRKAAGVGEHVVARHEPHPLLRWTRVAIHRKAGSSVGSMIANNHRATLAIELAQVFDALDLVAEGDF